MIHLMYYSQPTPNDSEELPATQAQKQEKGTLCSYFPCIVKLSLCATLTILSDDVIISTLGIKVIILFL